MKTQHAIPENSHFGFAFPFGFLLSQHPGVISNENTYHSVLVSLSIIGEDVL